MSGYFSSHKYGLQVIFKSGHLRSRVTVTLVVVWVSNVYFVVVNRLRQVDDLGSIVILLALSETPLDFWLCRNLVVMLLRFCK